jgi:hypothetical protein
MIATDRLIFLHLHKSGGTFVNALLARCIPTARRIGYHLPYREVPEEHRGLPVVGTVRNPWHYYVSWFHFQRDQRNPNILFQICSDRGNLGFSQTVANLAALASDKPRLAELEENVPDDFVNFGLNLTKKCVGELRERQVGFYSFLYERLYAGAANPTIMRMEMLREDLRQVLVDAGYMPNDCAERFLREAPPLNTSRHNSPAEYYDPDLASLIAERDGVVIDRYGYSL